MIQVITIKLNFKFIYINYKLIISFKLESFINKLRLHTLPYFLECI